MSKTYENQFLKHYIAAALWSSNDESTPSGGEPFDKNYGPEDIHPDTLAKMAADCEKFQSENAADLLHHDIPAGAHDFWLTRNSHGSGYWDGDWPEGVSERLTDAAHAFGGVDLYIGDDGKIHSN